MGCAEFQEAHFIHKALQRQRQVKQHCRHAAEQWWWSFPSELCNLFGLG